MPFNENRVVCRDLTLLNKSFKYGGLIPLIDLKTSKIIFSNLLAFTFPKKVPNDGAVTKVGKDKSFSQHQSGILIKITFDSVQGT